MLPVWNIGGCIWQFMKVGICTSWNDVWNGLLNLKCYCIEYSPCGKEGTISTSQNFLFTSTLTTITMYSCLTSTYWLASNNPDVPVTYFTYLHWTLVYWSSSQCIQKNLVMPFTIRMFEVSNEPLALVAQFMCDTLLRHMSATNSHSN